MLIITPIATCRADEQVIKRDCGDLSAVESYLCYREELNTVEKELELVIASAESAISKKFGTNTARTEIKSRLIDGQNAWLKYREAQCQSTYVTDAPIHPPSQSLSITLCRIKKTKERMNEIQETFLDN